MENTKNTTAALGVDPEAKPNESNALLIAVLMMMLSGKEPPRERELAERLAYLSGKVEALEKSLFGT